MNKPSLDEMLKVLGLYDKVDVRNLTAIEMITIIRLYQKFINSN